MNYFSIFIKKKIVFSWNIEAIFFIRELNYNFVSSVLSFTQCFYVSYRAASNG